MKTQRYQVVKCSQCGNDRGEILYYDENEPFNIDKHWAVCDHCIERGYDK